MSTIAPAEKPKLNPWLFIPLLFFMQAVPVTLVQEVSTIVFKDLAIENEPITRWTSIIALPWAMQMLLGPFVDLNFTKRGWILGGQAVVAIGLIGFAAAIGMPQAFEFSLVVLGLTALFSALCNIATDGFAILSMTQTQQAQFAGFMSTFYRLGRLFCSALLVFIAGMLMKLPPISVSAYQIPYAFDDQSKPLTQVDLIVQGGFLVPNNGAKPVGFEIKIPPGTYKLAIDPAGEVYATTLNGESVAGTIPMPKGAIVENSPVETRNPKQVWSLVIFGGALLYGLLHLIGRRTLPKPETVESSPPLGEGTSEQSELRGGVDRSWQQNLIRTLALIMTGVGGYFLLNALVRLGAHAIWAVRDGTIKPPDAKDFAGLQGWRLPDDNKIPFLNDLSFGGVGTELFQFALCAVIVGIGLTIARRTLVGSEMGRALGSFIQQPGFGAIFFFILFYRFPEAMVGKISPLFLKDAIDKGGLAVSNEQLGILSGLLGVVGIIVGGIVGGLTVSKIGLRRSFVPLFLAMHVPNFLYLALSYGKIPLAYVDLAWPGQLSLTLGGVLFLDQFGYGFGFAGYMVYLMWVAQHGQFTTSWYAIGTGMGALCIAIAGVLSGVLQQNFGYTGTFIAVIVLSIPGLASLLMIPLDESHKSIKIQAE